MIITCVIPCFNGAQTIERAIKSALDAGCDRVEVLDDSSTDNTVEVLGNMLGKYDMSFSSTSNPARLGATTARNILIFKATDGLIIPLDADDTLHDITPLLNAYEPNTWVYGDYNEVSGDSVTRIKGAPAGTLARKNITGVTFLFSKADWIKCGGYNPNYAFCEDYALQCNLTHNGIRPKYVETIVYDRYVYPDGNKRTALATEYWTFYHQMCKRDYPLAFQNA